MAKKTQKWMTKEQKVLHELQRLELSEWWKILCEALQDDKAHLINQLVYDFEWTDVDKQYSKADLWRHKIKLIEDMMLMPQAIKNVTEPMIDTWTPTYM